MEEKCEELQVPIGTLKSISFSISNNKDLVSAALNNISSAVNVCVKPKLIVNGIYIYIYIYIF